jgi:type IV secretory pathway VirB10-like protein
VSEPGLKILGVVVTIILHGALGTSLALMERSDSSSSHQDSFDFENAQTVEAALAFKSAEPQKQPEMPKNVPPPPEEITGVSRDETKVVEPKPEDKKPDKPPPPDVNIADVLRKNRRYDPDEEIRTVGADDTQTGSSGPGSEWGTEKEARGDAYVGELRGRVQTVWKVPSLEKGSGTTLGCVRLDADGKIVDRKVWKKSGIANLDRSVDEALREATDMDKPVPDYLMNLLTKKGICFRFTP